ncbi:MAG: LCP family protein [Firmicutes bacterium]|nr:LCP family protein [Bacillota bacterium]
MRSDKQSPMASKKKEKKPLTRKQRRRRALYIGVPIAAIVIGVGVGFAMGGSLVQGIPSALLSTLTHHDTLTQPENILLIGNNARNPAGPLDLSSDGEGGGQADIMMIAHIDPIKHQVVLISLPRDAMFAMPQYNNPIPKLKTFFFIGAQLQPNQAAQLTVQAAEKFTGMQISHWIVTDFQGFSDAINAVGGVRIYVPARITDPLHSGANFYPGWQTINGQEALAYIRVRQNTASDVAVNDYQRDDDQAQVLLALKNKLLDTGNDFMNLGKLISAWNKDVATDMNDSQLLAAARAARGAKMIHINLGTVGDSMDVASAPAPGLNQENYITGAFYDIIDPAKVTKKLKPYGSTGAWTGITLPPPSQIPVQFYGSQATFQELQQAGYQVTYMGSGGTYPAEIDYPAGDMAWGLQVGRTLATGNSLVQPGSNSSAVVVYAP